MHSVVLTTSVAASVAIYHSCNTIGYIPHAPPFILVTYSFHTWKPISPTSLITVTHIHASISNKYCKLSVLKQQKYGLL